MAVLTDKNLQKNVQRDAEKLGNPWIKSNRKTSRSVIKQKKAGDHIKILTFLYFWHAYEPYFTPK